MRQSLVKGHIHLAKLLAILLATALLTHPLSEFPARLSIIEGNTGTYI